MGVSEALLTVLRALAQEEAQARQKPATFESWDDYRRWQQAWNPNWSPACELNIDSTSQ